MAHAETFLYGFNVYESKVTRGKGSTCRPILNMKALFLKVGKLCAELKIFPNVGPRSRTRSCDKIYSSIGKLLS